MPEAIVKQIEKSTIDFLWNDSRPKIKLQKLQNTKEYGGFILVNLTKKDQALKVQWIQDIVNDISLQNLAYKHLQPLTREEIWKCNIAVEDISSIGIEKGFWLDVLTAWVEYNYAIPINDTQILDQNIWYNSWIKINKKPELY